MLHRPKVICNGLRASFDFADASVFKLALKRVAVFGTRWVMESALFGMIDPVEFVAATPEETAYILKLCRDCGEG